MLRKILFPTDFSEASIRVKKQLIKMVNCGVKEVTLLYIMDEKRLAFAEYIDSFSFGSLNLDRTLKVKNQKRLNEWKIEMEKAGLKVKTAIINGTPFTSIIEYAKEKKMTSIFIGHTGHDKNKDNILLGSTAEKIARKASTSVVLI